MFTLSRILFCIAIFCTLTVQAQLAVTVAPPKITAQKAIVSLAMTNNLTESVGSARAICFLLDEQGKMIGQSSKWVIGGTKDRPALSPKNGTTFNFVITSQKPFTTTNLTAKVSFSRVVLNGDKLADVTKAVIITNRK
ncbi:MAG: hypothetical protein WCH99_00390 [Verrucomicrobiota bacterium]